MDLHVHIPEPVSVGVVEGLRAHLDHKADLALVTVFVAVAVRQENAALGLFRAQVNGNNYLVVKYFELFNIAQFPKNDIFGVFIV